MMGRYQNQAFATGYVDEGVYDLFDYEELEGPTLVDEGDVGWFGISDRCFQLHWRSWRSPMAP